jgi:DNA-binding transcriptional ArsR family regulator
MLQRAVDKLFHALADPTRRAMIERLGVGPTSVSELGKPFAVSLSAIGQHLRVLEASGLVVTRKEGRVRTVELAPAALRTAEDWFASHRKQWERRFDRLGVLLEADDVDDASNENRSRRTR